MAIFNSYVKLPEGILGYEMNTMDLWLMDGLKVWG